MYMMLVWRTVVCRIRDLVADEAWTELDTYISDEINKMSFAADVAEACHGDAECVAEIRAMAQRLDRFNGQTAERMPEILQHLA